jgi:hypothetical protein
MPAFFVKREALAPALAKLERHRRATASASVSLTIATTSAFNVVARLGAQSPGQGVVVIGAHYDHLGLGERHSLAPDSHLPHLGADDNGSGTAALLEVARQLALHPQALAKDILFVAFSGEEEGDLGSTAFTRAPPGGLTMRDVRAMINMDMVGRLRENRVTILGATSGAEWPALLDAACADARIDCLLSPTGGFGPSDQMPFYAAGVPVAHFFTGSHADYHKPTDSADRINAAGAAQVAAAAVSLGARVAARAEPITLKQMTAPPAEGDMRSFNASLGTIPDYAGPPGGASGVLLAGVRPGAPAEKGGLRRGDILVRLGDHPIGSVEDLMYALNASHPGETAVAVVKREGNELRLPVTFEESRHGK